MLRKLLTCCCFIYLCVILSLLRSGGIHRHLRNNYEWKQQTGDTENLMGGYRKLAEINDVTKETYNYEPRVEELMKNCHLENTLDYRCSKACYNLSSSTSQITQPLSPECRLSNLARHCEALKSLHNYNTIPVTDEERYFPLAFAIKMHEWPVQAEQLFRTIYRSHNLYCFHVDMKADNQTYETIKKVATCFDNVIVIEDRETVISSSFAHVKSEIKCMKALSQSNISWKYYINLSGQEFPLRTNFEMVKILKFFKGLNDIETYNHPIFHSWRYENSFQVVHNGVVQVGKKQPLKYDIKLSMGNAFGLFSRRFVEFILTDDVAKNVIAWFNDTFAPHESVWATLVTLPWAPGNYPITVRHMINSFVSRAMIVTGDTPRCHGHYLRGQCLFSCGDIEWLTSRPEFVASKFDYSRDRGTLNCLESWYRDKAGHPETIEINWDHYNKLPHLKHHRNVKHLYKSPKKVLETKEEWLKEHTI